MVILVIFLMKLLSLIGGLVAIVVGALASPKWIIAVAAFAGAMVSEVILQANQVTRTFDILEFVIALIAFAVWGAVGNLVVRRAFKKGA